METTHYGCTALFEMLQVSLQILGIHLHRNYRDLCLRVDGESLGFERLLNKDLPILEYHHYMLCKTVLVG